MRSVQRWTRAVLVVALAGVVLVPLGAAPSWACSYLPLSVEEAVVSDRHPSSAVVIVRRIDDGAGIDGQVEVVEVVQGEVPDTFDVTFDNGGSCAPSFRPGQIAGLLVNTTGGSVVAEEASQLSQDSVLSHLHGDLAVDPAASGEPAVVIAGRMPGADLAVLDDQLRVLAHTDTQSSPWMLEVCGDLVATLQYGDNGGLAVHTYGLPGLAGGDIASLPSVAESSRQDLGCVDGAVAVIANGTPRENVADGQAVLYPDASADDAVSIPGFIEGSVAGDRAVLLTASADEGSELAVVGMEGTELRPRIHLDERVYAVSVSPDGATVAAWAADGEHLTIDTTSGEVLGRFTGGSTWVGSSWMSPDELVFAANDQTTPHESSAVSIRDTALAEHRRIEVPGLPIAAVGGLFALTAEGLAALDRDGRRIVTAPPQTILAGTVVATRPIAPAAPATPSPAATHPPAVEAADEQPSSSGDPSIPPSGTSSAAVVTVFGMAAVGAVGLILVAGRPRG